MNEHDSDARPASRLGNVVEGTGDFASNLIHTAGGVLEDVVHSVGRLGTVAVAEVFNVLGSVTTGFKTTIQRRPSSHDDNNNA